MKQFILILLIALGVSTFLSCEDDYQLGSQPTLDNVKYSATPDAESPNVIHFAFDTDGLTPFWRIERPDGTMFTSNKRKFSITYMIKGEYDGILQVYGRGGASDSLNFKFTVPNSEPIIELLTGTDAQKIWVWDANTLGHLACGWIYSELPDWWILEPNELVGKGLYDDELSFMTEGRIYKLDAHGDVYVDGSATEVMNPNGGGALTVPYEQPEGETWSLEQNDKGEMFLSFSGHGFPSFVGGPKARGAKYKVLELSENKLSLRWDDVDTETSWFYNFIVKR